MRSMYVIGHLVIIMLTNTNLEMEDYYRHISLRRMPKNTHFLFLQLKLFQLKMISVCQEKIHVSQHTG